MEISHFPPSWYRTGYTDISLLMLHFLWTKLRKGVSLKHQLGKIAEMEWQMKRIEWWLYLWGGKERGEYGTCTEEKAAELWETNISYGSLLIFLKALLTTGWFFHRWSSVLSYINICQSHMLGIWLLCASSLEGQVRRGILLSNMAYKIFHVSHGQRKQMRSSWRGKDWSWDIPGLIHLPGETGRHGEESGGRSPCWCKWCRTGGRNCQ